MNLTETAFISLTTALTNFGNVLSVSHKQALFSLLGSMSRMAEGRLQGRWAFGLPTGTGKTRAIIEWATAVVRLKLPYTLAVSASRIEALCTLKREMMENGIPEGMIGLLHDDLKASLKATDDNDDRPFMLITHQRIRGKASNLQQYNFYQGHARNLLVYDESLMVSDVQHFDFEDLCAALAHAIAKTKRHPEHAEIYNFMVECLAQIEYVFDNYEEAQHELHLIKQPYLSPKAAEYYTREWEKEGTIAHFLRAANLDLRMLRSGKSAVVSYRIVIPQELKNIIVLDASYPIRKLCLFDQSIENAETLPGLKKAGVKSFHELKRFDHVQLYRLRSFGGRHSMEKRFKDRSMAKEVVEVLKTLPESEAALLYVYKMNQPGGIDYRKVLSQEIVKAGIYLNATTPKGEPRISIQTWGNETSLNCYAHCSKVFLVGILHRDETELMGLYLGQTNDITGDVDKRLANDLQLSEKSHLAYQALSRGTCRTVQNGQALPMQGYIVEIDPEIETTLSSVMPGVKWETWKPYFIEESEDLVQTWARKVLEYLAVLETGIDRVSSRSIKKALKADKVHPSTWKRVIKQVTGLMGDGVVSSNKTMTLKNTMGDGPVSQWRLEGQSLVRQTMEQYGFIEEVA